MRLTLRLFLTANLLHSTASVYLANQQWPLIQPFQQTYDFSNRKLDVDTPVRVALKDVDGVVRYRLECHNGEYDGAFVIFYSGMFQCAIAAVDGERETTWNLLAEDRKIQHSADWWNRGRFLVKHLREPCSRYEEYGPVRTFRFRRMLLTIAIKDVRWEGIAKDGDPIPAGFKVDLKVDTDATANGAVTVSPAVPRPPRQCFP
jgi:hypothetical protein